MKKKLPRFRSDKEAEDFVEKADLTEYDLSAMRPIRFEFQPKSERVNMRVPRQLLGAGLRGQGGSSLPALHPPGAGGRGTAETCVTSEIGARRLNYRILYFFHGRVAAILAHGLTKEDRVPGAAIDAAFMRKQRYEQDRKLHTFEKS